jgi:hypothetical protein
MDAQLVIACSRSDYGGDHKPNQHNADAEAKPPIEWPDHKPLPFGASDHLEEGLVAEESPNLRQPNWERDHHEDKYGRQTGPDRMLLMDPLPPLPKAQ